MVKIKGFYTDEQKRIRPLTEYFKEYEERGKIEEHKQELVQKITSLPPVDPRPKSTRQAMELLSRGQLMAVEAQGLQIAFDKINQEKFKGKVPKTQILFTRLPFKTVSK